MKRVGLLLATCLAAVACGSFLAAPDQRAQDDGGTPSTTDAATDATGLADGAGPDGGAPVPPPICPFRLCDDLPSTVTTPCSDEACESSLDWSTAGGVTTDGTNCRALAAGGASAVATQDENPAGLRRYAMLSLSLVSAVVDGRAIASISVSPDGERFEAVVRAGTLFLCERSGSDEKCTAGVPFSQTSHILLYGTVSTTDPPNAPFALAVDSCGAPQVLSATCPFTAGSQVKGAVGCHAGPNDCDIVFSASSIFVHDE